MLLQTCLSEEILMNAVLVLMNVTRKIHRANFYDRVETKGRFRKRVVLANVPSFRFWIPGEHPKTSAKNLGIGNGVAVSADRVAAINPLSTIRTRCGNSVSTPGATRTGKNQQNSLQKGSRYGNSVSTQQVLNVCA